MTPTQLLKKREDNIQYARRRRLRAGRRVDPNKFGTTIRVDFTTLERARIRDGRSAFRLMQDIGRNPAGWQRIKERGSCKLSTADALCVALGIDLWECEVTP